VYNEQFTIERVLFIIYIVKNGMPLSFYEVCKTKMQQAKPEKFVEILEILIQKLEVIKDI